MSKIPGFGAHDPLSVTESGNAVTVDVSAVADIDVFARFFCHSPHTRSSNHPESALPTTTFSLVKRDSPTRVTPELNRLNLETLIYALITGENSEEKRCNTGFTAVVPGRETKGRDFTDHEDSMQIFYLRSGIKPVNHGCQRPMETVPFIPELSVRQIHRRCATHLSIKLALVLSFGDLLTIAAIHFLQLITKGGKSLPGAVPLSASCSLVIHPPDSITLAFPHHRRVPEFRPTRIPTSNELPRLISYTFAIISRFEASFAEIDAPSRNECFPKKGAHQKLLKNGLHGVWMAGNGLDCEKQKYESSPEMGVDGCVLVPAMNSGRSHLMYCLSNTLNTAHCLGNDSLRPLHLYPVSETASSSLGCGILRFSSLYPNHLCIPVPIFFPLQIDEDSRIRRSWRCLLDAE
ncbi:hypothetical protein B0H13DRAFT_2280163 [Mycena leptocephala]|nr:hypothetical protein B0H13DRAFT_2280163 [Mycena leptocephala]